MAGLPYRARTGNSSGRGTEGSGAVPPLSANAAAAVAAAIGHVSLSRRGTAASSSSIAAGHAAVRGSDAASSSRAPAAAASSEPVEAGGREGWPGTHAFEGRAVIRKSSGSSSSSKVRPLTSAAAAGTRTSSDTVSGAAAATDAPVAAGTTRHVTAAAAAAAPAGGAAGKAGSSSAINGGGTAEPVNTVDLLGRRVWDKSYYEARAQSKAEEEDYLDFLPAPRQKKVAPPVEHRRPLQRRDFSIDLTRELGRSKIVTLQTPRMQQGGFWCDVCECLIKDSAAYLDHVNGRNHNRMLGMTMRVERAPPERVIGKLRELERQAQLELEGEDYSDNTAAGNVTAVGGVGGAAAEGGGVDTVVSPLHTKSEPASAASGAGAPAAAGKVKRPLFEENYDDIDRIKRRLEELQKQEEERKLKRKLKKKRKKAESGGAAEDDENTQHVKMDEKQGVAVKEDEDEETEEQKMLKAMGLPCGFVGS